MTPLGKLVTELSLDDKQFQDALKKNEALVKILKSSLGDLSSIKIGEGGKIIIDPAKTNQSTQSLQQLRLELVRLKAEIEGKAIGSDTFNILKTQISDVETQIKTATASQKEKNEVDETASQKLRNFYREQRVQDRTMRETTQSVLGLTFGLSALLNSTDSNNEGMKRFERTVLTAVVAMQAGEFTATGLGVALERSGGQIGKFGAFLRGNAGIIGAAIGGIGLLSSVAVEAGKAMNEDAARGVKRFVDEVKEMSDEKLLDSMVKVRTELQQTQKSSFGFFDLAKGLAAGDIQSAVTSFNRFLGSQNDINNAKEKQKAVDDEIGDRNNKNLSLIQQYEVSIKELVRKRNEEPNSLEKVKKLNDEIARQEALKAELLETTLEKRQREVEITSEFSKQQNAINAKTVSNINDTLEKQLLAHAKTEQERIEIQRQFAVQRLKNEAIYQSQLLNLEREGLEKLLPLQTGKAAKETQDKISSIKNQLQNLQTGLASDIQKVNIEAGITLGEIPAGSIAAQQQKVTDLQKQLNQEVDAEKRAQIQSQYDLEKNLLGEMQAQAQYGIGSIGAQQFKIAQLQQEINKATSDEQRELLRQQYDYEKNLLDDMQKTKSQQFQESLEQSVRIAGVLSNAFSKSGDDFLRKLSQALQIALNIAKVTSAMNAKGGGSPLDFLEIFANIAGIGALFDSGGYTGSGDPKKIAGGVHYEEIVFEQPLVKKHGADLMSLRSQLQKGASVRESIETLAPKYLSGGGSYQAQDLTPMLNEMRAMRSTIAEQKEAIANMQFVVNLYGTLEGQQFLEQAMPKFRQFESKKNIDE